MEGLIPALTPTPIFQELSIQEITGKLKLVPQYRHANVKVHLENISIVKCIPLQKVINLNKLVVAQCIVQTFLASSIDLYLPVRLASQIEAKLLQPFANDYSKNPFALTSFMMPPIIEIVDNKCYIIDGMHRIYLARSLGYSEVCVITLTGVNSPLPSKAIQWKDLICTVGSTTRAEKFDGYQESYWRDLKKAYRG